MLSGYLRPGRATALCLLLVAPMTARPVAAETACDRLALLALPASTVTSATTSHRSCRGSAAPRRLATRSGCSWSSASSIAVAVLGPTTST